jgi:hypothetical protein
LIHARFNRNRYFFVLQERRCSLWLTACSLPRTALSAQPAAVLPFDF